MVEVYDDIEDDIGEHFLEGFEDEMIEFNHETGEDEETKDWFKNVSGDISKKSNTIDVSYEMYNMGKPINEIATTRNLKIRTIEEHLIKKWSNTKEKIDLDRINLTRDMINDIKQVIDKVGCNKLRPIKDSIINQKISYFHIKIIVLELC